MKKTDVVNKNMIEQGLYVYFFSFFKFLTVNWLFFKYHNTLCLPPPPNFMHKYAIHLGICNPPILEHYFENYSNM